MASCLRHAIRHLMHKAAQRDHDPIGSPSPAPLRVVRRQIIDRPAGATRRKELIGRLLAGRCEICEHIESTGTTSASFPTSTSRDGNNPSGPKRLRDSHPQGLENCEPSWTTAGTAPPPPSKRSWSHSHRG
jgi:hypothetical protein